MTVEDRVDAVIHIAWPPYPTDYLRWSIETLEGGSLRHTARAREGCGVLLAPTPETYGNPKV